MQCRFLKYLITLNLGYHFNKTPSQTVTSETKCSASKINKTDIIINMKYCYAFYKQLYSGNCLKSQSPVNMNGIVAVKGQ